jgi:2-aminoadipate transaminase
MMRMNDLPNKQWVLARRAEKMNPSVIREILKVTERPGIISFAGGLPSPRTFPVAEFAAACEKVLRDDGPAALQYAASEGYGPLREMVAAMLPWQVDPAQVLITTGSQQGLDLVAKILIDAGSRVLVETPTYLGALQDFTPMEPEVMAVASDDDGVLVDAVAAATQAVPARFLYCLPSTCARSCWRRNGWPCHSSGSTRAMNSGSSARPSTGPGTRTAWCRSSKTAISCSGNPM